MNKVIFVAIAGTLLTTGNASADPDLELARAKQCLSCHAVDEPALAPSFKSIAAKYNGRHATRAQVIALERTIKRGPPDAGDYHWGPMTMPEPGVRALVSNAQAVQLTQWILGLKESASVQTSRPSPESQREQSPGSSPIPLWMQ